MYLNKRVYVYVWICPDTHYSNPQLWVNNTGKVKVVSRGRELILMKEIGSQNEGRCGS